MGDKLSKIVAEGAFGMYGSDSGKMTSKEIYKILVKENGREVAFETISKKIREDDDLQEKLFDNDIKWPI